jgi:pimeloyl-ACP methyl ester carboxylesterase
LDFATSRLRRLFGKGSKPPPVENADAVGGEEADESAVLDSPPISEQPPGHATPGRRDLYFRSADGLSLHVAEYGDPLSPWLPVVCLPGLSRSARDFDDLANHLSTHGQRPRRVLAFDLRGRGQSEWDKDISHYSPLVEMQDVLDGMAALAVDRSVVVGTSRGGIIAILIAVARPSVVAGVVLNDIGPAIEPKGLARIKTYVGRTPAPDDWDDAVRILRRLHGGQFTSLSDADWRAFARMTWCEQDGVPVGDYDPALARTFDGVEFDRPMPTLWKEFAALAGVPVLVIRGENSDILSAETVGRMEKRHPRFDQITIEGQGHAPLLIHDAIFQRISVFVSGIEGQAAPLDAAVPRSPTAFDIDTPVKA